MIISEDSMITDTRRSYTEGFKEEAVRLVWDLGIAGHLLYHWRADQQQAEGQNRTCHSVRAEQAELARLRRDNAHVEAGAGFS